jgi:hypothetical protein
VPRLARAVVGGVLEDDHGFAAGHDVEHVTSKELRLLRCGAVVTVVLADHVVRRRAIEICHGLVAEQEVAFVVFHHDQVGALVDHRAQQGPLRAKVTLDIAAVPGLAAEMLQSRPKLVDLEVERQA